jgi:hypothetical protein
LAITAWNHGRLSRRVELGWVAVNGSSVNAEFTKRTPFSLAPLVILFQNQRNIVSDDLPEVLIARGGSAEVCSRALSVVESLH